MKFLCWLSGHKWIGVGEVNTPKTEYYVFECKHCLRRCTWHLRKDGVNIRWDDKNHDQ